MTTQQLSATQALHLGQQYQQQGDLQQAEGIYRQILQSEPNYADAWHLLGLLASQAGNHEAAAKLIIHAISLDSQAAQYRLHLGNALLALEKIEPALVCYRQAQQLKPDYAEAYYNMASVLQTQGRFDEAATVYQCALDWQPDLVEAHCNLGSIFQEQGRIEDALACYHRAISVRPDFARAQYNLGSILEQQKKPEEALACYRNAARLQPDYAEAHANLAGVLHALQRPDEAIQSYQEALRLNPDIVGAQLNLGTALLDQGKQREAIACYRETARLTPDFREARSNLLFTLLYSPDYTAAEIFAEHVAFSRDFEGPLLPRIASHRNSREPGRRLRIGYNSFNFGDHPVAWFLEPLLANHDRQQFEIYCYANRNSQDSVKQRIMGYADHWRTLEGVSDEAAAALIRNDEIDILIDLSGHSGGNRLTIFAHKPAPVQATWLGYLNSSGLSGMDCRITDSWADPAGLTEEFHSERLLRLPDSQWCYSARARCPDVSPLPALGNGYLTFGSFSNLAKVTPQALDLWGRLLAALPTSRMVMLVVEPGETRRAIEQAFAAHGVASGRLTLLPSLGLYEYLEQYRQVDVALDTFPYNGGTTTCDAMWMGVPLITLAGAHSIARGGVSVLSNLGLTEFIATTPEQYVDIGVRLAARIDDLNKIRTGLRDRMRNSSLMDAKRFATNMEALYRQMWRDWCANGSL